MSRMRGGGMGAGFTPTSRWEQRRLWGTFLRQVMAGVGCLGTDLCRRDLLRRQRRWESGRCEHRVAVRQARAGGSRSGDASSAAPAGCVPGHLRARWPLGQPGLRRWGRGPWYEPVRAPLIRHLLGVRRLRALLVHQRSGRGEVRHRSSRREIPPAHPIGWAIGGAGWARLGGRGFRGGPGGVGRPASRPVFWFQLC